MKDIEVVVEKMTKNRRKVIGKPGDSLLCRLHHSGFGSSVFFSLWMFHENPPSGFFNARTIFKYVERCFRVEAEQQI